ncbi:hypothetical protein V5R04_07065 [Jonesiaceae bacterium BS-20]|uniref:Uncharacterized protein n=1 Tax=Jonesiaceae bacterium BS-20 TaxID=3120821 RepID=A0AAU7DZ28_9MICO
MSTDLERTLEQAHAATVVAAQATQQHTQFQLAGAAEADQVKTALATGLSTLATARQQALEQHARAVEAVQAKKRELDATLAQLTQDLAPVEAQIKILQEGIWTVNLYLGRDETIVQLAEGAPAEAAEPICVRQQVLAMDEESLLRVEDGGMDVRDIDAFDAWVVSGPANLNQLIPEQRGVVAIMARRSQRDYGDPWLSASLAEANTQTWWLIRNGANVYRMLTDLKVGKRLVPARDEFTAMFVDHRTGERLVPGTPAWLRAEEAAGAQERHYMRIALVLQGLLDRTAVFHPLPAGGVNLLSPQAYDDGLIRLIADDENILTDGRQPYRQWHRQLMTHLDVGTRVIVSTHSSAFNDARDGRFGTHARLHPERASYPQNNAIHTIARVDQWGQFVFLYENTSKDIWDHATFSYRAPKTRASCVLEGTDEFVIPLDYATVEDMEYYLTSRANREHYESMVPALRTAIAVKKAEAETEEPFRAYLASQLDVPHGRELIDTLVTWWKIGNKHHRALVGDGPSEVKAARAILSFAARILALQDADQQVLAQIRADHRDALLIARKTDGTFMVLEAQERKYTHNSLAGVYTTRTQYTKTGKVKDTVQWWLPVAHVVSKWLPVHESAQWLTWPRTQTHHGVLTDHEIDRLASDLVADYSHQAAVMDVRYTEDFWAHDSSHRFTVRLWDQVPFEATEGLLSVPDPGTGQSFVSVRWERDKEGVAQLHADRRESDRDYGPNGGLLVWTPPPSVLQAFDVRQQEHRDWKAKCKSLGEEVNAIIARVSQAWVAAQRDVVRARFLEDYAEETLWADHSKSFRPVELHPRWDECAPLKNALIIMLESGADVTGLTVGDLLAVPGLTFDDLERKLTAAQLELLLNVTVEGAANAQP